MDSYSFKVAHSCSIRGQGSGQVGNSMGTSFSISIISIEKNYGQFLLIHVYHISFQWAIYNINGQKTQVPQLDLIPAFTSLFYMMAWCPFSSKPLSKVILTQLSLPYGVIRPKWINYIQLMYLKGVFFK